MKNFLFGLFFSILAFQFIVSADQYPIIFLHGNDHKSKLDTIINYKSWDGSNWTAKLENNFGTILFIHAPNGDWSKCHKDKIINYKTWDGSNWTAKLENNFKGILFIHAPNGDWSKCHKDKIINYKTWDSSNWKAQVIQGYRNKP